MEQKNKIPLRQFYRNIDDYILNQAHDEAILYSKFLLGKYPKDVRIYQLLGKTFLDTQQYDLAFLFFEKVLEIEPDDFVSHIGISLISENFGNLDQALESMRRAYEIQPSNESLQNEVIRLIRSKDGFAPEKLRLTRGALIKMYGRSKLTEQAIAEARLGIHEAPDRADYKIQLATMLLTEKKYEEAIEESLKILKAYPYCKPVLEVLYRSLSALDGDSDADLYKSRLAEVDPYYVFMKPETESVNDIPDVAIMVEAGNFPLSQINNLKLFIEDTWKNELEPINAARETGEHDWQSIVDDAVANNGIGEPIQGDDAEEVHLENSSETLDEISKTTHFSKREKFISKLSPPKTNDSELPSEEIPDWILSYGKLESHQVELRSEDGNAQTEIVPVQDQEFQEDGMTDHAVPVNPMLENEKFISNAATWQSSNGISDFAEEPEEKSPLEDTQKIKILKQDPDDIVYQLESALNEKDDDFAMQCAEALLAKDHNLEELAAQLENYLQDFPGVIELWLFLVRVYRKLGKNDKALSALESAQLNISI